MQRTCQNCGPLPVEQFSTTVKQLKTGRFKTYYRRVCRDCEREYFADNYQSNKEARRKSHKDWRLRNPERLRGYFLKSEYGITSEEYVALYETQDGVCAICSLPERKLPTLAVDHDHVTGKIRGLLCSSCNLGIGHFKDDVGLLRNASNYLENQ